MEKHPDNDGDLSNSSHTCITCRVVFTRADLQRDHYKSDWHRYNLKRKVAELPPVTASLFQSKVLAQRQQEAEKTKDVSFRCKACYKTFQSKETFESHGRSKKHLENVAKRKDEPNMSLAEEQVLTEPAKAKDIPEVEASGDEDEWETDEETEGREEIPTSDCLFCSHSSKDDGMEGNLSHMSVQHGFFIPDVEYCTDMEGLMTYLGAKVGMGFVCLWCNERGRSFRSLDAVQKHMRDKCHCKVNNEGEAMLEFADFYDYSTSYPDADEHRQGDLDEAGMNALDEQGWQLVLPSGATIGHRSLMRYYRQRLKTDSRVQISNKSGRAATILNRYRALGWTGTTGEAAARKAKDLAVINKLLSKQRLKVGVTGNKLQHHYRRQVNF